MKALPYMRSTASNPLRQTRTPANNHVKKRPGEPARDKRQRDMTAALADVLCFKNR